MAGTGDGPDRYLFVVATDDDADREDVEALFDDYEEGEIEAPEGVVRVATGVDHDDLHAKLSTKLSSRRVNSYRLEPVEAEPSERTLTVERRLDAQHEVVRRWVNSTISKKKAVSRPGDGEYDVYTRKGTAHVSYELTEDDEGTHVRIRVSGYQPAPEFLADFLETRLAEYADR